jgi:hypothetical protein
LYDRYTAGLFGKEKKGKRKKVVGAATADANIAQAALLEEEPVTLSSPVCYADSPGLREGFAEE